jgi:uncharacterized protein
MSDPTSSVTTQPTPEDAISIDRMLRWRRIVIVGASNNPSRASFAIASYLLAQGYDIVPVNPNYNVVLGMPCLPSLDQVSGRFELVNVFRRSEHCEEVARQAIAHRATAVWLQSGITSPGARKLADAAGIDYIENRCIMVEHMRKGAPSRFLNPELRP